MTIPTNAATYAAKTKSLERVDLVVWYVLEMEQAEKLQDFDRMRWLKEDAKQHNITNVFRGKEML